MTQCSVSAGAFDVIIIGAGLAGLTAGAYLTRAGARVLVCEQAPQVGGLFNSFWQQGYLFDGGIKAIENSGIMLAMLRELGLLDQIDLVPSPIAIIADGVLRPVRAWEDVEAYFRWLIAAWPGQEAGLRRILRDVQTVFDLLGGLLSFPIPSLVGPDAVKAARHEWLRTHGRGLLGLPRVASLLGPELRAYLSARLDDPSLVNFMAGLFPEGTTAFFGLAYWLIFLDYYYPRQGVRAMPDALAGYTEAGGGEIRLRAKVEQVLLHAGRAAGVRLASGEEIAAGCVIAAGDLRQTLLELLPAGSLPAEMERAVRAARYSHTAVNVYLGLDLPPEALPFEHYGHVYYLPDLQGISAEDRRSRPDYFLHVPQELSIPCLHAPHLAPPGKTGLIVSCMTNWHYGGGWGQPGAAYEALKERATRDLLVSLGRVVPGLEDHIELVSTGTPRTIVAQTLNTEGAIMGWAWEKGAGLQRGSFLQMRGSVHTPVPGLLVAGHWAWSPGGSPIAALTARLAANEALKAVS